jgi:tetratricopeptide (TPR) repeat protein
MDLMDFTAEPLYFEETVPPEAESLIEKASGLYGKGAAEAPLLEAYRLAPESLNVLVALYRFYYYQQRLEEALDIAGRALDLTSRRLGIPRDFSLLTTGHLDQGGAGAMALLRFHLFSLKAQAYLLLRLNRPAEGKAILTRLLALDSHNRLGARQLLEAVEDPLS